MDIDALHHLQKVRQILLALPGVEECISYRTPGFKVKKKLLARLKEDGETLVVHIDDRDPWMVADPASFFFTDHYRNYPTVLVRLPVVQQQHLQAILFESWKQAAPGKLLLAYERTTS